MLSTRAETVPLQAHRVNAEGAARLLRLAEESGGRPPRPLRLPEFDRGVRRPPRRPRGRPAAPVREDEHLNPLTLYGAQKLYIERLGAALERRGGGLDFRAVRLPGLISSDTVPQGGDE